MSRIAARLAELNLVPAAELIAPPEVQFLFPWINVRGTSVFVSGHGPQNADGALAGPFGQVGHDVTLDDAHGLARKVALAMIGNLQRELGDLDRIVAWRRVFGMVNSAPGFGHQPAVINGFSEMILDVFGPEIGRHSRSAVGMAALPFNMAVEIEAELEISL
jgi:enamine deaminase RidA (YjgF/YER057c/UK114 family)